LVQEICAVNPRTVMVLVSSFPYAINWHQANVPAIVQMAHSSQEQGTALTDVLFGDFNPAGRLSMTWPKSLAGLPPITDYDLRKGRTYLYDKRKPLYPFGYGLSYTKFKYSNLRVGSNMVTAMGAVDVSFDLTNTGKTAGDEVAQMYVRHLNSRVSRPLKELKGFRRVNLAPGETRRITLRLDGPKLAYWSDSGHDWIVEPDRIEVAIGASSVDLRLKKVLSIQAGELPATSALTVP